MVKKILKKLGLVVIIPSLLLNLYFLFRNSSFSDSGVYIRDVIDGDTLVTDTGSRIRLLRVDAPELEFCLGEEAKERLKELTVGKKAVLKDQAGDSFGRILALVYVKGKLVNETMLEEGYVRYQGGSSLEKDRLQAASDKAREEKVGIYSEKCRQTVNPDDPSCNIKGNIDKTTGKKTYHFPGCSGYANNVVVEKDLGESWFCSEKDAQKTGFTKSENCYGKSY